MLGVPWLYPTEINSLPMRTKGAAVATATDWITNFVIVEITPIGIQNIGWKFCEFDQLPRLCFASANNVLGIVWTVTNAAFLPILYFFYPETGQYRERDFLCALTNIYSQRTEVSRILMTITATTRPLLWSKSRMRFADAAPRGISIVKTSKLRRLPSARVYQ